MTADLSHTFVIPAYGHSVHLRDCLASLRAQTRPSRIVIATSTPFDGLEALAAEFSAELVTHGPNAGIGHDWNFALEQARRWDRKPGQGRPNRRASPIWKVR